MNKYGIQWNKFALYIIAFSLSTTEYANFLKCSMSNIHKTDHL